LGDFLLETLRCTARPNKNISFNQEKNGVFATDR